MVYVVIALVFLSNCVCVCVSAGGSGGTERGIQEISDNIQHFCNNGKQAIVLYVHVQ